MRSRSVKTFVLWAFVLASPALTFAREDSRVQKNPPRESQKPTDKNRDIGVRAGGNMVVQTKRQAPTHTRRQDAFRK
jgi:hypothetical protein